MILTKSIDKNLYSSILGQTPGGYADALVKVGGESVTKFVPNINASKWGDECWVNINNRAVTVASEKQIFVDGKVDLIVGNDCHRYLLTPDGHLEYQIIFASRPGPEILLDLKFSDGLRFDYQPFIEDEPLMYPGEIISRPPNVEGAYAMQFQKKCNKYQTGVFGMIYRPLLIDMNGNRSWCKLLVDPSANIIQILMDDTFLRDAIYPVTLDPTIGYETVGGTGATAGGVIFGCRFASPGAGNANPGTFSAHLISGDRPAPATGVFGVYADSGGSVGGQALLSTAVTLSSSAMTSEWVDGAITWNNILASTDYWLCASFDTPNNKLNYYYNTGTAGYNDLEYKARTYDGTLPATFPASPSSVARQVSFHVDYTAAAIGQPAIKRFGGVPFAGNRNAQGVHVW